MTKTLGQKIRIYPTKEQRDILDKNFNYAIWCWNAGLKYIAAQVKDNGRISEYNIRNHIKSMECPLSDKYLFKDIPATVATALEQAYDKTCHHGKLPETRTRDKFFSSFTIFKHEKKRSYAEDASERLMLHRWLKVKASEPLRYSGHAIRATISQRHNRYYVSVTYDIDDSDPEYDQVLPSTGKQCGIDVGILNTITVHDSDNSNYDINDIDGYTLKEKIDYLEERRKRLQRQLSHIKQYNANYAKSRNYEKLRLKLYKTYVKAKDVKTNFFNKAIHMLFAKYDFVGHETLGVNAMHRSGHHTGHSLQERSLKELLSTFDLKAKLTNKMTQGVPGDFPSSQMCSRCGQIHKEEKKLSNRRMKCDCGLDIDRDVNAAINIYNKSLEMIRSVA